jgi:hypothetical protein
MNLAIKGVSRPAVQPDLRILEFGILHTKLRNGTSYLWLWPTRNGTTSTWYCSQTVFFSRIPNCERQGATHHGGAGNVGASDVSLDSQEAPRKLHDNNGVLGFLRNAISGPDIGTMVALKTPHDVQKIFLVVWRRKV